jgi:WhiB family redox-sensing transcriptional regulator
MDPELWFPEQGGSGATAKLICAKCPVRRECLDYALAEPEPLMGVWGGLTAHERRQPRRQYRRAS